jgi:hypothetical protein
MRKYSNVGLPQDCGRRVTPPIRASAKAERIDTGDGAAHRRDPTRSIATRGVNVFAAANTCRA